MALRYDGDWLVGGGPSEAVSPSFRVRELLARGTPYVHRELIAALQELRDACGGPITVARVAAPNGWRPREAGLAAEIRGTDPARLLAEARRLPARGFPARAKRNGDVITIGVPASDALGPLSAPDAFARAVRVTAAYETNGEPFECCCGNFDGAGLSFGPLQVNFGSGTLPALFERFRRADEQALAACFARREHWTEWLAVLALPRARQLAWAETISCGRDRRGVRAPWRDYLRAVGRVAAFREVTLQYAWETYGRKLIVALSWLKGLWPGRIDRFACLAALYDLCVQQGGLDRAHAAIRARVAREAPADQFGLTRIAVEERGRSAAPRWRADCLSRRLGILWREPVTVREAGHTAMRRNLRIYLVRDVPVTGAERYLT